MFRRLRADEIDVRVQSCTEKGAILLLYKDARADMNILDETVGSMNWKREHTRDNQNCIVSLWNKEINQWISKEDTGTESNTEKEKGLASDSFKRACFNWGIGRELYTTGLVWVNADKMNITERNGKKTTYDKFSVKEISYDNYGNINVLKIYNENKKIICFEKVVAETESQKKARLEKEKTEQLALHGKLVHDLNGHLGDDMDKLDELLKYMNKSFKTDNKWLIDFTNEQLEKIIKIYEKKGGK